ASLEILLSAEGIKSLIEGCRVGNGVDREVASREVLLQRRTELDFRMPSVGANVPAERRHFVHPPISVQYANRSKVDPDWNCPPPTEDLAHLGRSGRGS